MKQFTSFFILFTIFFALPFGNFAEAKRNRKIGDVLEVKGKVSVQRKDKKIKTKKGSGLKENDQIVTGKKETLFFDFSRTKSKIRMAEETDVTLLDKGTYNDEPNLKIKQGLVWVHKSPGNHVLRLKTPLGLLKILDAQFYLSVGPGDNEKVAVKQGRVEIEGEFGRLVISDGSEATLFSGVPPIIKGISDDGFTLWAEPFEGF